MTISSKKRHQIPGRTSNENKVNQGRCRGLEAQSHDRAAYPEAAGARLGQPDDGLLRVQQGRLECSLGTHSLRRNRRGWNLGTRHHDQQCARQQHHQRPVRAYPYRAELHGDRKGVGHDAARNHGLR